jgi:hypothetical protein
MVPVPQSGYLEVAFAEEPEPLFTAKERREHKEGI